MKKSMRTTFRMLSCVLTLCLLLGGFSVGQFMVAADEVTGYQNEAVVCFKNVGSGKYLNVHYGQDSNNVNVYQWTRDESTEQKFRLRYNLEDDCYLIGAMCSSNGNGRVLDIVKSGGEVADGCNVQIYNAVDPVAQQWQIRYEEDGKFAIYPIDNYFLLLTANGSSNGSGSGTSSTSAGNVYLSEIGLRERPNDYQLWMIEEVDPQATIPSGTYRIKNANGKFITADADDMSNVHQLRDPGNISGLGELEQSTLLGQQLWDVQYLCSGYYLIRLAKDTTQKLGATGDFSTIQATAHITTQSDTSDCLVQWKIVPNVQGGYRIVNKGDYNTQALTVLYGDTDDETPIVMSPYVNATSQQWTFPVANSNMCTGTSIGGHAVYLSNSSGNYQCVLCNRSFANPAEEDYKNLYMSMQDRAVIVALQQLALHETLEGNEAFSQSCYRVVDLIRSSYNGRYLYGMHDSQGNYISPAEYTYTADTVNTRVEIELETKTDLTNAVNDIVWYAGQQCPFPFNVISSVVLDYTEDYEWCTLSDLMKITGLAIVDGKIQKQIIGTNKELKFLVALATLTYGVYQGATTSQLQDEYHIRIRLQNEQGTHTFSCVYRATEIYDETIYIVKETHSTTEGQSMDYEANEVDCIYFFEDSTYSIKPFFEIF